MRRSEARVRQVSTTSFSLSWLSRRYNLSVSFLSKISRYIATAQALSVVSATAVQFARDLWMSQMEHESICSITNSKHRVFHFFPIFTILYTHKELRTNCPCLDGLYSHWTNSPYEGLCPVIGPQLSTLCKRLRGNGFFAPTDNRIACLCNPAMQQESRNSSCTICKVLNRARLQKSKLNSVVTVVAYNSRGPLLSRWDAIRSANCSTFCTPNAQFLKWFYGNIVRNSGRASWQTVVKG